MKRNLLTQPCRPLRMVSVVISSVRMYKRRQRSSMNYQPWNECTKLGRIEDIDLEHGDWVWPDRFVPQAVDSQFWKLSSNSLPELCSILCFVLRVLLEVDVDVETTADPIGHGICELCVG